VRLTPGQEALWLAEQMSPGTSVRHVCGAWTLDGSVNIPALQKALREVVRRHPVMSASIDVEDGVAFQVVQAEDSIALDLVDCAAGAGAQGRASDATMQGAVSAVLHRTFDLEAGPLVRVALLRRDATHSVLCVAAHHIIWDGLSTDVFARELASCYGSALDGTLPGRDESGRSFLDVAAAAGEGLSADQSADLAWWEETLTPLPDPLSLPLRHAAANRSGRATTVSRTLSPELTTGIRRVSRIQRATSFMTTLAAFASLLYRLTGQQDMTIAVPESGRTEPDTEGMIGLFVQTLPFRVSVRPEDCFAELLDVVRGVTLDAMAHHGVPYPTLVRDMAPKRPEATDPLCQVAFQLRRRVQDNLVLPGVSIERYDVGAPQSAYDLTMTIEDDGESMTSLISFDPCSFDVGAVQRLLRRYETLLTAMLEAPDSRLGALSILDAGEERLLIDDWGGRTKAGFVPRTTVHALFEQCARLRPDAVAVEEGESAMTYGELDAQANGLALLLRAHGVSTGSVVGLLIGRSATTVVAMLATLKAGAAYMPLDPDYPPARLSTMIRTAHPSVVLAASQPREDVDRSVPVLILADALAESSSRSGRLEDAPTGPEDPAYVIFTSGSTGEPKGVVVPHRGVIQLVSDHGYWDTDESDCVAHLSTVAFDVATLEIWGTLCRGARLVVVDRDTVLSPALLEQTLERHGVTVAVFTTSLFNMLAREVPGMLGHLRAVQFGGEVADPGAVRLLLASGPPTRLINAYGPTEATTFALWYEVHEVSDAAVTVPVGRPIAGATAYVVDPSGHLVAPGTPGELWIGGGGVALGYLGDRKLTAAKFAPDPWSTTPGSWLYKTGDSAVWREDGNVEVMGRLDGQVKLRGFRIEPGEIVAALERIEGVQRAVVIVREDRPGDRRLVAYIVSDNGRSLDSGAIAASLAEVLPSFMLPSACVQVSSLPMTLAGKLDVRSLPAPVPGIRSVAPVEPSNEVERRLSEVWKRVLGLDRIGVDDNFFELGGHSLTAVRLVADVEHTTGMRIPMSTLFEAPTVRALAALLSKDGWAPSWNCIVPICTTGSLPPVFCVHGYGNEVLWASGISRKLGADQPVFGLQPLGLDGRTEPLNRIEDMARRYVTEMCAIAREGPYYLIGYSLGGAIAFEMARQLEAARQQVAFLGLIDSGFPGMQEARRISLLMRLRLHARAMAARESAGAIRYAGHRIRSLWRRIAPEKDPRAAAARRVARASEKAWRSYAPGVWKGRITFFASTEQDETIWEDSRPRWRAIAGEGMQVIPVPGVHESILQSTELAEAIRTSLRIARETCEGDTHAN
jgi:amino acid adenylation domain-containing protein